MAIYVKLGALIVKQASKPLANAMKRNATEHERFRARLLWLGQKMHDWNVGLTNAMRADEGSRRVFAGKLDEEAAVRKAADFVGEVLIFSIAGAAVAYEVRISSKKDAAKAAVIAAEKAQLQATLDELAAGVAATAAQLRSLEARVAAREVPWWRSVGGRGAAARVVEAGGAARVALAASAAEPTLLRALAPRVRRSWALDALEPQLYASC